MGGCVDVGRMLVSSSTSGITASTAPLPSKYGLGMPGFALIMCGAEEPPNSGNEEESSDANDAFRVVYFHSEPGSHYHEGVTKALDCEVRDAPALAIPILLLIFCYVAPSQCLD